MRGPLAIGRHRLVGLLGLAVLSGSPDTAADPPPRGLKMHWPDDGGPPVLVTNRGLIFADPGEQQFRLLCNRALDVGSAVGDEPKLAYVGSGVWMAATYAGLMTSADQGCTWAAVEPFSDVAAPALVQASPATIWVATYGAGQSALWVTRNMGRSWTTALTLADTDYTHSLAPSPSNPMRIYGAGIDSSDAGGLQHYLLRSSDGGASWDRQAVALGSIDERASVVAVHPSNEDEVVLMTTSISPGQYAGRVMVSRDGGDTFSTAFEGQDVLDVTYARDGAELWVADYDGVAVSSDGLVTFERRGPAAWTSCVAEHAGRLWICGQIEGLTAAASGVGVSDDGARTLTKWLDFRDIVDPVACPSDSAAAATCEPAWAHWQVEVLGRTDIGDGGPDANVGSGGASAEGGAAPIASGGGIMRTTGGATSVGTGGSTQRRTKANDDGWCNVASDVPPLRWQSFAALVALYFCRRIARATRQ